MLNSWLKEETNNEFSLHAPKLVKEFKKRSAIILSKRRKLELNSKHAQNNSENYRDAFQTKLPELTCSVLYRVCHNTVKIPRVY